MALNNQVHIHVFCNSAFGKCEMDYDIFTVRRSGDFYGHIPYNICNARNGLGSGRRLMGRKGHPRWPFGYEVILHATRHVMEQSNRLSPAEQRVFQDSLAAPFRAGKRVRRERVQAGGMDAEWFVPVDIDPGRAPTILCLHGGGYASGSLRTHCDVAARLALACGARADHRISARARASLPGRG